MAAAETGIINSFRNIATCSWSPKDNVEEIAYETSQRLQRYTRFGRKRVFLDRITVPHEAFRMEF